MEINEEVILSITLGYMKYISQFYGLNEKITNKKKNCFRIGEEAKLTMKIDSRISNINL